MKIHEFLYSAEDIRTKYTPTVQQRDLNVIMVEKDRMVVTDGKRLLVGYPSDHRWKIFTEMMECSPSRFFLRPKNRIKKSKEEAVFSHKQITALGTEYEILLDQNVKNYPNTLELLSQYRQKIKSKELRFAKVSSEDWKNLIIKGKKSFGQDPTVQVLLDNEELWFSNIKNQVRITKNTPIKNLDEFYLDLDLIPKNFLPKEIAVSNLKNGGQIVLRNGRNLALVLGKIQH